MTLSGMGGNQSRRASIISVATNLLRCALFGQATHHYL
jgi:hypothetical protein